MRASAPLLLLALAGCGSSPLGVDGGGFGPAPDLAGPAFNPLTDRLIDLPAWTLPPGEEKILCFYVPPEGRDRWINRFTVDMSPGSHHLITLVVGDRGPTAMGPGRCDDLFTGLQAMLPGAQEPHTVMALPEGMAVRLSGGNGLYFQSHYINSTAQPMTAHVTYTMTGIDAAAVKQTAGHMFYSNFGVTVPPGKSTASMSCHAPAALDILYATGHMHMHALHFDATVAGRPLYHTDNWDQPSGGVYPAPGFAVAKGEAIKWSCAYDNQTGMTLHFGDSAVMNEMCILAGIYYPAPNSQTLFLCQ